MPRINTDYKKDVRKRIIDTALEIAREKGWNALTLDAISKKMNISRGTLYLYFKNSEGLFREVSIEVFQKIRTDLVIIFKENEDIHQIIRNIADLVFEQQKPYSSIFCQIPLMIPQNSLYTGEFISIYDYNIQLMFSPGNLSSGPPKKSDHPL